MVTYRGVDAVGAAAANVLSRSRYRSSETITRRIIKTELLAIFVTELV